MTPPKDKLTRFFEIFPGLLTWGTLILAPVFSYLHPAWVAVYIILFDLYWFLKAANVATHLMHSYQSLKTHNTIDWNDWLIRLPDFERFKTDLKQHVDITKSGKKRNFYKNQLARLNRLNPMQRNFDFNRIYHLIILPTYQEDLAVLESSIVSYATSNYPKDKMIFVLAAEERGGKSTIENARILFEKYAGTFYKFLLVIHPDGVEGEAKVKGANISHAAEEAKKFLDSEKISYENVIVSAFDSDTIVAKNYFAHLTFDFLTALKPLQTSYQPMPMFLNNIWDTPAIARVIAVSSSFWQLVEASRPDRLVTFSSHSMSFKTLSDVGFWRRDIIPDDSHIFWQCFVHYSGDYKAEPLFTTVYMDAVLGESYWGTLIAQYKQKRRWAWGVLEISMLFPEFLRNKKIPLWKKLVYGERLVEGHYFWATASVLIAILGWLPLLLGGDRFGDSVLALNLPFITKIIMSVATFFLIFSMYVNMVILPPRPPQYSRWKTLSMLLQWVFSPIVSSIFGSFPAIDAQTRLMLGKYMEFFVTPKHRKTKVEIGPVDYVHS